jgi:nucleotide-binding universal stress UspA family protein
VLDETGILSKACSISTPPAEAVLRCINGGYPKTGQLEAFLLWSGLMSYAALMVYVDNEGIPEQRVRIASDLAKKFDAALIGFSARAVPPPFVAEGVIIEEATEADIKQMQAALAKRGDWFRGVVGAGRPDIEWRTALDFPADALAREARSADLVILGQQTQHTQGRYDNSRTLDPGEALLKLGRPALLVAAGAASLRAEHVVVAWKDGREARRAVLDAMPFLRTAKRVSVVEVCDPDEKENTLARINDVVRYLERHKINADPRPVLHRDRSDANHLFQFALDEGADLLVTGAYGRSRLGEWIFGGMTREILASSPICCLMSH